MNVEETLNDLCGIQNAQVFSLAERNAALDHLYLMIAVHDNTTVCYTALLMALN